MSVQPLQHFVLPEELSEEDQSDDSVQQSKSPSFFIPTVAMMAEYAAEMRQKASSSQQPVVLPKEQPKEVQPEEHHFDSPPPFFIPPPSMMVAKWRAGLPPASSMKPKELSKRVHFDEHSDKPPSFFIPPTHMLAGGGQLGGPSSGFPPSTSRKRAHEDSALPSNEMGGLPPPSKKVKQLLTSVTASRSQTAEETRALRELELARTKRDTLIAKIKYQRLRIREFDAMRIMIIEECNETEAALKNAECQIAEIERDLTRDGISLPEKRTSLFGPHGPEHDDGEHTVRANSASNSGSNS